LPKETFDRAFEDVMLVTAEIRAGVMRPVAAAPIDKQSKNDRNQPTPMPSCDSP
jgi:hypothetical protein